jgi:ABC-type branched-subunit amino acid transport system substrate-binding protein
VRRSLVVAVVLALLLAACGNSSDNNNAAKSTSSGGSVNTGSVDTNQHVAVSAPGVTDTEIRYSALGTNSNNPLGTCVLDCFVDGINAYFDLINNQGGIYGRKLVVSQKVDDELANNQAKAQEIVSANDTFGTFSAAELATGWGDLADAGIPTYVWMIDPANASGHPEIFGNAPVICTTCTSRWVANAAKLAGATKVATLGYSASAASKTCADSAADSIKKYGPNIGNPQVVYTKDDLDFGLPNGIATEVTAMKNAGVDFIALCIDLNGAKTLAQELQRQGMRDKVTMYHANTYDQQFVKDSGGLFDNDLILAQFRPFEAQSGQSSLQDFHNQMKKLGKPESEIAMVGWIDAITAVAGLKAAGPSFDRQKVIDGTNALKQFTADGLVSPVDWGRQHEAPTEDDIATHGWAHDCQSLVKVNNGNFVIEGDPAKPFNCWPGTTRDWSDPVPTDFN